MTIFRMSKLSAETQNDSEVQGPQKTAHHFCTCGLAFEVQGFCNPLPKKEMHRAEITILHDGGKPSDPCMGGLGFRESVLGSRVGSL